jgi:hypothetical protein
MSQASLKGLAKRTDVRPVTLLLAFVVGWCLVSIALALGLGPLLRRAGELAERNEPRQIVVPEHSAA